MKTLLIVLLLLTGCAASKDATNPTSETLVTIDLTKRYTKYGEKQEESGHWVSFFKTRSDKKDVLTIRSERKPIVSIGDTLTLKLFEEEVSQ